MFQFVKREAIFNRKKKKKCLKIAETNKGWEISDFKTATNLDPWIFKNLVWL